MKYSIICSRCGSIQFKEPAYKCEICGGILEFHYNKDNFENKEKQDIVKFIKKNNVPLDYEFANISLGEGNTPLIPDNPTFKENMSPQIHFKLEGLNPTGSFKDRGIIVSILKALELGIDTAIIASSGNASASAAAYASRAGIRLIALVPEKTPTNKLLQAINYGAVVIKVKGNFSNSYKLCLEIAKKYGWFNITTTFNNPYSIEGYKMIGYEIYEQLSAVPDWIIIPIGDGPILAAIYKSFTELLNAKVIDRIPRLVGVQAKKCSPIVEGYKSGLGVPLNFEPEPTVASGIDDPLNGYEEDGNYTIQCIQRSKGTAIAIEEEGIIESSKILATKGIYSELAGGVGWSALKKLCKQNIIPEDSKVVIIITGNGLKNSLNYNQIESPIIENILDFDKILTNNEF